MSFPYAWVGGGVAALALIGGFATLDASKNHYKRLYLDDETKIGVLHSQLDELTDTQNIQKTATDKTVTKVVQAPAQIVTVVKTIHDAPNPANCGTPVLPQNVKDLM
jgi:hypothetical protein